MFNDLIGNGSVWFTARLWFLFTSAAIQSYKERLCFYKPAGPITKAKEPNHHDQSVIKDAIVLEECTQMKIIKPADGSYTDQTAEEKNICKPTISWMKVDCIDMQREVNSKEVSISVFICKYMVLLVQLYDAQNTKKLQIWDCFMLYLYCWSIMVTLLLNCCNFNLVLIFLSN